MNQHVLLPANTSLYYGRMAHSLKDKLFFVDRLPGDISVAVDFGCGDGKLLDAVSYELPQLRHLIGYDLATDALALAKQRSPDVFWTPSIAHVRLKLDALHKAGHKSVLILSSVIHEVLSSGTSWAAFWETVRSLGCDYVVIRDMAVSVEAFTTKVDPETESRLSAAPELQDIMLFGTKEPGTFESRAEMLQALLKFGYEADLEKELAENYFAVTAEMYLNLTMVGSGYSVRHYDHHSLKFNRDRWSELFGVKVCDPTHIKIILKRN